MTTVDIQFSPAHGDWAMLRDAAVAVDSDGTFGALWVFDHLAGASLGGTTMLECFTLLGALATVTERIELGTMVANVWNRQPGTLVSAAASVALLTDRRFHLGIGAGASPTGRWAAEHLAVGAFLEPSLPARHARVEEVLDLAARERAPDRDEAFASFPRPDPAPTLIVGAGSVALSRLAGARADGITLPWRHPRRDEFLAAADAVAGGRRFLRIAYTTYDPALLDADHPERRAMTERRIDRLVLAQFSAPDPPG